MLNLHGEFSVGKKALDGQPRMRTAHSFLFMSDSGTTLESHLCYKVMEMFPQRQNLSSDQPGGK